jgi:hypothetical protein
LLRAKRHSKRSGRSLRSLVEQGLELVLAQEAAVRPRYQIPDCSVGRVGDGNPLESWSWQDLRDEIYGPGRR